MESKKAKRAPYPTEFVLVDGLMTCIARRMAGALDLGLLLLHEPPAERYAHYVADHVAAPMRAAALLLRVTVAEAAPAPALIPHEAISLDTEAFVAALSDLARYTSLPDAELKAAVDRLGRSFRRIHESHMDVAERLGFEATLSAGGLQGRNAFYEDILDRLYADLSSDRARGEPGITPCA